jgi:tetratricopeptide (TPR) repeat protein
MLKYFFTLMAGIVITAAVIAQPSVKAKAFFNNGIKFKESGMVLEAVASFKKAIALNKKYDSAYLELGMLYVKFSKADSAIMTLKNAVKFNPAFTNAYIAMGNIYRDYTKNPDEAIVNYLSALKTDSSNKATLYSIAWCYNAKEYHREAIKYAIKALEIDNNYKPAYNELGHAYRKLGAYEEAVTQFKKNMAVSVNELPYLYSGYCYIELKQKENALLMFDELNKLNPKMAEALKKRIDTMQ